MKTFEQPAYNGWNDGDKTVNTSNEKGKHTPGPWSCERSGDGKWYTIGDGQSAWGTHVAEVYSDDTDRDEAAANAALIQHSPDLLSALEVFLERYVSMVNSGDCGHWDPETEDFVITARAAIAKAKGEQS